MNTGEFNTELGKLMDRALAEGLSQRKMSIIDLIGVLELQKLEVMRGLQDMARAQAAKQQPRIHLPGSRPPPLPGT